jgi:replicative DNA helicase
VTAPAFASMEAERAILGGALRDSNLIATTGGLRPGDFGREAHRRIWATCERLAGRGEAVDLVTVAAELTARSDLEAVGGAAYLGGLVDGLPAVTSLESWANVLRDRSRRRAVATAAERLRTLAGDPSVTPADAVSRAFSVLDAAAGEAGSLTSLDSAAGVDAALASLLRSARGEDTGWSCGLAPLDRCIGHLRPGRLIIVAGRPGSGKTTLAVNVAEAVAGAGGAVYFASYEMTAAELNTRRIIAASKVPASRFSYPHVTLTGREASALESAAADLRGRRFIVDEAASDGAELRARARYIQAKSGLDLVVVDYLQLVPPGEAGKRADSREREVAAVARSLKRLAQELKVTVLAGAQLNRALEGRQDSRPRLSDLRESGSIEQDSDVVAMLHPAEAGDTVELLVRKHRHGATSECQLTFDGSRYRFEALA